MSRMYSTIGTPSQQAIPPEARRKAEAHARRTANARLVVSLLTIAAVVIAVIGLMDILWGISR